MENKEVKRETLYERIRGKEWTDPFDNLLKAMIEYFNQCYGIIIKLSFYDWPLGSEEKDVQYSVKLCDGHNDVFKYPAKIITDLSFNYLWIEDVNGRLFIKGLIDTGWFYIEIRELDKHGYDFYQSGLFLNETLHCDNFNSPKQCQKIWTCYSSRPHIVDKMRAKGTYAY